VADLEKAAPVTGEVMVGNDAANSRAVVEVLVGARKDKREGKRLEARKS
jgi:hypothetical protein